MSAFIVNKSHINAMLQGALASARKRNNWRFGWYHNKERHELTLENASEVGQMLLDENIKSVSYRYGDSPLTDLPGRADGEYLLPFEFNLMGKTPKPIEILSITNCYSYQACEHDKWEQSEAKSFCDTLLAHTIRDLPGYDEAPWEWEEKLPATKVIRMV